VCGRFTLTVPTFEELADALGVVADPRLAAGYVPRFNVAPSQRAWVVARGVDGPELRLSRWGFDSRRSPEERPRRPVLNAPTYTLGGSAAFRLATRDGRIVVIADGFFEWIAGDRDRRPFWFRPTDGRLLHMAAVQSVVEQPTFAIVTTEASNDVQDVHERMPLLLDPEATRRWLSGAPLPDSRGPSSIVRLRRTRVGLRVNDVRNDDAACVEPGPEPPAAEGRTLDLFGEALGDVAPRKRRPRR
jgi:putative SOS response-associated peptidase YedK